MGVWGFLPLLLRDSPSGEEEELPPHGPLPVDFLSSKRLIWPPQPQRDLPRCISKGRDGPLSRRGTGGQRASFVPTANEKAGGGGAVGKSAAAPALPSPHSALQPGRRCGVPWGTRGASAPEQELHRCGAGGTWQCPRGGKEGGGAPARQGQAALFLQSCHGDRAPGMVPLNGTGQAWEGHLRRGPAPGEWLSKGRGGGPGGRACSASPSPTSRVGAKRGVPAYRARCQPGRSNSLPSRGPPVSLGAARSGLHCSHASSGLLKDTLLGAALEYCP